MFIFLKVISYLQTFLTSSLTYFINKPSSSKKKNKKKKKNSSEHKEGKRFSPLQKILYPLLIKQGKDCSSVHSVYLF